MIAIACAGCGFRIASHTGHDADVADATVGQDGADAAASSDCSTDPHLRVCLSFDQTPLPTTLANEGRAIVDATLTNVSRIAHGTGGAARMSPTSEIFMPMSSEVTNIQAMEMWFQLTTELDNTKRAGLVDSNTTSNISLFVYRTDPVHQFRCGMGSDVFVWDVATLPLATWIYVACVCDASSLTMYVDGLPIGAHPGGACSSGGAFVGDGFTIGSDNTGNPTVVGDVLPGAIDTVRLWDVTLSAHTICETAGRSGC